MTTRKVRAPRAQSKEAYRLWFEFLRRAIEEDESRVRLSLYKAWGDITGCSFDRWWRQTGERVIDLRLSSVGFVEKGAADDSSYLLRVPKSLTSTQIGNEVRKFLISAGHAPMQQSKLRVRLGAEIRPAVYRAYLHTYDQHRKLVSRANGSRVTAKELLKAVREFYLQREERYRNNNRTVDKLPSALATGMNRNNLDDLDVLHAASAINAVSRYLRQANMILDAVRDGRFPD